MMRILIPLCDGVEEMEAVAIVDVLRRAKWEVTLAAVGIVASDMIVTCSRGVRIQADGRWETLDRMSFDALVIPGGKQCIDRLRAEKCVLETVRDFVRANKWIGAICAAPLVLQAAGVLAGRKATCHPSLWPELTSADLQKARVVVDERIITSQGPGTALEFALSLIRQIASIEAAESVAKRLAI